jgi:5-methylcytosine-specific restriction endonuclease McrA
MQTVARTDDATLQALQPTRVPRTHHRRLQSLLLPRSPCEHWPSVDELDQGKPEAWRETRRSILSRARYRCVLCGQDAIVVDHLFPQAWGGDESRSNLRAMRPRCHRAKTQGVTAGATAGRGDTGGAGGDDRALRGGMALRNYFRRRIV